MLEGSYLWSLVMLAVASYTQNMAFTWTSRSRNSGDPSYHRFAAICSNGIWFVCNILIFKNVWHALERENLWLLLPVFIVYVISTTEGSVHMMRILLKTEKGKRKVGAS